ncbi:MAG: hypothetical protein AB7F64_08770 [Gammaproteobacteria bacterium]
MNPSNNTPTYHSSSKYLITEQQKQSFITAIEIGLKERSNSNAAKALGAKIKSKRNIQDIISLILSAQPFAINTFVCNQLINKLKDEFGLVKCIFELLVSSNLATVVTYNSYIASAGYAGQFFEAKEAFCAAKNKKLADVFTYSSYITTAGRAGQFYQVQTAFSDSKKLKLVNEVTYNAYITAAGQAGQFQEAQKAFDEIKELNLADKVTYSSYIMAAGNTGHFEAAQAAFDEAKRLMLANVVTYSAYITAAGNRFQFAEAQAAFNEVKQLMLANVVTYSNYIIAAGQVGQFEESHKAFDEAQKLNLIDVVTYNALMDVTILADPVVSKAYYDQLFKDFQTDQSNILKIKWPIISIEKVLLRHGLAYML